MCGEYDYRPVFVCRDRARDPTTQPAWQSCEYCDVRNFVTRCNLQLKPGLSQESQANLFSQIKKKEKRNRILDIARNIFLVFSTLYFNFKLTVK